jgi:hypothetical protein
MTTCMCFLSSEFRALGADSWLRVISLQVSLTGTYDNQYDDRVPDAPDVPVNGAKINLIFLNRGCRNACWHIKIFMCASKCSC